MNIHDLLKIISELPVPEPGQPVVPPREVTGFFVYWARGMRQWKQGTLASFADVSLSTVQRIERGERVSNESLDRVAEALGYERGYFTSPRIAIDGETAAATWEENYGHMIPVDVRPLRTQPQVKEIAQCHCYVPHMVDLPDAFKADVSCLIEWVDLVAFVTSETVTDTASEKVSRRKLYRDVLDHVDRLESLGITVLAGVVHVPQKDWPNYKAAILSFTLKASDPGAIKRRTILVDRRCVQISPGAFKLLPEYDI